MRLNSLRSKLMISVSALVVGSGLVISILETKRFSHRLREAAITQGIYISKAVALEATNKVLTNDLVALQNLLNYQLASNPTLTYLFVLKDNEVLAHTFPEGIPRQLIGINTIDNTEQGHFKRIINHVGEHYLDIAWPIFSGKAGILRLGISEKHSRSEVLKLWMQMTAITLIILALALFASYLFIRRITHPLFALAKAAENIDEKNLELNLEPGSRDEVGSLTTSFNQMLERIKNHTRRIEKKTFELDRAYRQTKISFEIIQKVGAQTSLKDVSSYLIYKFRQIVSCSQLGMLVYNSDKTTIFVINEHEFNMLPADPYKEALSELAQLEGVTFIKNKSFVPPIVPNTFQSAVQFAGFPIKHERQFFGALLAACPGQCHCDIKELEVIRLILNHSAGAIRRAVGHEEEMLHIKNRLDI